MLPEKIAQKLNGKDLRITVQRGIVLKVFMKNPEIHWTPDQVFREIACEHPQMGRATVYRTLDLLAELGILNKLAFPDGRIRYELQIEDGHHHHHLVCLECGQVYDFRSDCLDAIEAEIAKVRNFTVYNHQLNFYGVCKYCKAYKKEVHMES